MKRFVILLMLALSLFSLSLSEGARAGGAYEKELLSGSFEGSKRLFLGLARVNAREATGAYITGSLTGKTALQSPLRTTAAL